MVPYRIAFLAPTNPGVPETPHGFVSEIDLKFGFVILDSRETRADMVNCTKSIIADRKLALVGSSNLSWHGMVANHELALLVEGRPAAEVASALDKLFHSTFCVRIEP